MLMNFGQDGVLCNMNRFAKGDRVEVTKEVLLNKHKRAKLCRVVQSSDNYSVVRFGRSSSKFFISNGSLRKIVDL